MNSVPARHSGYTILELMISLVLMATLMMVAWSILGSYRDAEQRGWNQTYQMQVIRIARQWLETDAAGLMDPSSSSPLIAFKGDDQGFDADLIPSLDPLVWLREIIRADEPLTTTTDAWAAANQNTATAMDPVAVHRLRYKMVAGATTTGTGEQLFDLQRELVPIDRWTKASSSSASEKLLSTEDLYRTEDEEMPVEAASSVNIPATSIRNLITPRFRYSDGKDWLSQWDSQFKGGLPRAIELSFDLPPASTDYEPIPNAADEADEWTADDFAIEGLASENIVSVETASSAVDDEAALARDVRIVVLVVGSVFSGVQHE